MNIFLSSIDNSNGKTIIGAGIAAVMQSLGYKTGVFKPIQTGAIDKGHYYVSPDLTFVKMLDPYITTHSTYMFKTKAIPYICSEIEKNEINIENIVKDYNILAQKLDTLIVESTGGLMTPVSDNAFLYHILQNLKIPIVFIVNPNADSVNHYLNEINTAKSLGFDITGVIINKYPVYSENADVKAFPSLIEKYSDVKVLGLIRNINQKTVTSTVIFNEILNGIDLEDIFRMKIPKLNGF